MRPICANCKREMFVKTNEVLVKDQAKGGSPSTYRYGDLYECPVCAAQIIIGFGGPFEEERARRLPDYKDALEFAR